MAKTIQCVCGACMLVLLGGCATEPKLAPKIEMPIVPKDEKTYVEAELHFKAASDLSENAVQMSNHTVEPASSVVINVPARILQANADSSEDDEVYKTKQFFNEAEQQIESTLIRSGFRVVSRAKLEAKLRNLRDESRCGVSYGCLRSQIGPEARPALDSLKEKLEAGDLTHAEYAVQAQQLKADFETASAGRSRSEDEQELTDISEVVRATESGGVQADYILNINRFDTRLESKATRDLRKVLAFQQFVRDHPAIREDFLDGHSEFSCAALGARLNGELVHVKTGEIVWIGEHEVNEFDSGVENITVEMGILKTPSNDHEVRRFVNKQNQHSARIGRYGKDQPEPPRFEFQKQFIEPREIAGECPQTIKVNDVKRRDLARAIARQLISTIRVGVD